MIEGKKVYTVYYESGDWLKYGFYEKEFALRALWAAYIDHLVALGIEPTKKQQEKILKELNETSGIKHFGHVDIVPVAVNLCTYSLAPYVFD